MTYCHWLDFAYFVAVAVLAVGALLAPWKRRP